MMDEESNSYLFPECMDEVTYWERGHPDDHHYLVPLCDTCGERELWHTDQAGYGNADHEFVDPRGLGKPLAWGENAHRENNCSGYFTPRPGVDGATCSCRCHWGHYYVNAYEIGRAYGGPEEGGWWYDTGEPVESVLFETLRAAETYRDNVANEKFPRTDKRNSVLGGEDYDLKIERHFARSFPDTRPHYE